MEDKIKEDAVAQMNKVRSKMEDRVRKAGYAWSLSSGFLVNGYLTLGSRLKGKATEESGCENRKACR